MDNKISRTEAIGLSWRTFALGILLCMATCIVGSWSSVERYDLIGTGHLPRVALYPLLIYGLVAWRMRRGGAAQQGTTQQLLFIYCMLLVMASIPGQRFANYFYVNLVGVIYYATPQNKHAEIFHGYLREWLVPSMDREDPSIRYLFEGMPEGMGFFDIPWGKWITPLLAWTPLILAVLFVSLCISVLLRKQWVEHERLLFPLAEVPVILADQAEGDQAPTPLFKNRLFWLFFAIPCVLILIRDFHFYYPKIIQWEWNLRFHSGDLFFESPWYVLNRREMSIYFDMLGIAYLLSNEIGFSFWFFWFWQRVEEMSRISLGIHDHWEWRYNTNFGGFLVLFLFYLYAARNHFRNILLRTFTRAHSGEDAREGMSYRFAFLGAVLGFFFIIAWCRLAGIEVIWAIAYFLFYFLLLIVLTRIVAEAGLFVFWLPTWPQDFLIRTFGSNLFSASTRTVLPFLGFNYHDTASAQLPNMLQALKVGTERRMNLRHLVIAMAVVLVVSVLTCHVTFLWALYETGIPHAGWWWPGVAMASVNQVVQHHAYAYEPRPREWGYFLMGGAFTGFLTYMRQRFLWWPFHPLGYVGSVTIERYWFSIFLGWLIKIIIVQIGGVRLWRRLLPCAIGMILGNAFILFTLLLVHHIWPIQGVLVIE